MTDGTVERIDSPSELPNPTHVEEIREPYILMNLILPSDSVGAIMKLCEDRRGTYKKTEYIGATRVILQYEIPLAEVIYDFYDKLKSATRGYGTMDYDFIGFRVGNLVKLDVLEYCCAKLSSVLILVRGFSQEPVKYPSPPMTERFSSGPGAAESHSAIPTTPVLGSLASPSRLIHWTQ
jgi:translation elongation factor EF-4